jgi:hypothetical protein
MVHHAQRKAIKESNAMSTDEIYMVFWMLGGFILIGLGYVTWVITRKERKQKHGR